MKPNTETISTTGNSKITASGTPTVYIISERTGRRWTAAYACDTLAEAETLAALVERRF